MAIHESTASGSLAGSNDNGMVDSGRMASKSRRTGIVAGIDYGDARTGVSLSDASGFLAGSPRVLTEWNQERLIETLAELLEAESVTEIVVGYPKNMDGSIGERAERCQAFAEALHARTGKPVTLWDERRTTIAAHAILHQSGKRMKAHKKTVDAVAATLILQGFLDWRRRQET